MSLGRQLWHRSFIQSTQHWFSRSSVRYSASAAVVCRTEPVLTINASVHTNGPDLSVVQNALALSIRNASSVVSLARSRQEFRNVFESPKQVLRLLQYVSSSTQAPMALEILVAVARMGCRLHQNMFETVCHNLTISKRWQHILLAVSLGQAITGQTTRRLLNWRTLALIKTERYAALDSMISEFEKASLIPDRRTFHLLIEGHLRNRDLEKAQFCLQQMQTYNIIPDETTQAKIVGAYRYIGSDPFVYDSTLSTLPALAQSDPPSATRTLNHLLQSRLNVLDYDGALYLLAYFRRDRIQPFFELMAERMGANPNTLDLRPVENIPPQDIDTETFALFLHLAVRQRDKRSTVFLLEHLPLLDLPLDETIVVALMHTWADDEPRRVLQLVSSMPKHPAFDAFFAQCESTLSFPPGDDIISAPNVPLSVRTFNAFLRAIVPHCPVDLTLLAVQTMRKAGLEPDSTTVEILLRRSRTLSPRLRSNSRALLHFYKHFCKATRTRPHLHHIHQIFAAEMLKTRRLVNGGSSWLKGSLQELGLRRLRPSKRPEAFTRLGNFAHPLASIEAPSRISSAVQRVSSKLGRRGVRSDASLYLTRLKHEGLVKRDIPAMRQVFDEMVQSGIPPNAYHVAAMMEGHVHSKDMPGAKKAMRLASNFGIKATVVMFTVLIAGFARLGLPDEALRVFTEMTDSGIQPDLASIDAVCGAFYAAGAANVAKRMLLAFWPKQHPLPPNMEDQKLIELLRIFRSLAVRQVIGEKMTKQEILITHMKIKILLGEWQRHPASEGVSENGEASLKRYKQQVTARMPGGLKQPYLPHPIEADGSDTDSSKHASIKDEPKGNPRR